ncbi:hypothetical protein G9A89_007790 [Geosiphon pyriformis]|nr:hypothetical protein G9A89_007790 [Geosiphon pyriformis]
MKQDTIQATLFELVYGRTATLPVEIKVNTYPIEPIIEDNFQETLLRRTYELMETLENKQQKTVNNIQKSQKKQKKRHDNQLPDKLVEFKIKNKVFLHCIKAKKQWNRLEILLNLEMDSITVNQMEKITNTQFEELQNKITQVILEKEVQKILKNRELELGDLENLNRAQY